MSQEVWILNRFLSSFFFVFLCHKIRDPDCAFFFAPFDTSLERKSLVQLPKMYYLFKLTQIIESKRTNSKSIMRGAKSLPGAHFCPFFTIFTIFRPFWTIFDHFSPFLMFFRNFKFKLKSPSPGLMRSWSVSKRWWIIHFNNEIVLMDLNGHFQG